MTSGAIWRPQKFSPIWAWGPRLCPFSVPFGPISVPFCPSPPKYVPRRGTDQKYMSLTEGQTKNICPSLRDRRIRGLGLSLLLSLAVNVCPSLKDRKKWVSLCEGEKIKFCLEYCIEIRDIVHYCSVLHGSLLYCSVFRVLHVSVQ